MAQHRIEILGTPSISVPGVRMVAMCWTKDEKDEIQIEVLPILNVVVRVVNHYKGSFLFLGDPEESEKPRTHREAIKAGYNHSGSEDQVRFLVLDPCGYGPIFVDDPDFPYMDRHDLLACPWPLEQDKEKLEKAKNFYVDNYRRELEYEKERAATVEARKSAGKDLGGKTPTREGDS